MKTLLLLKRFDLALQVCALVVPALMFFSSGQTLGALFLYFAVGGMQFISFLTHAVAGKQDWMLEERVRYGKLVLILFIVAAIVLLGVRIDDSMIIAGLVVGAVYLVGTPVMAVVYFLICLRESGRVGHAVQRSILIVRGV